MVLYKNVYTTSSVALLQDSEIDLRLFAERYFHSLKTSYLHTTIKVGQGDEEDSGGERRSSNLYIIYAI